MITSEQKGMKEKKDGKEMLRKGMPLGRRWGGKYGG